LGWQGLSFPAEYGGQGLPLSLAILKSEMMATANWTWGMYPGLSKGCINTLLAHGTDQLKKDYLTKLVEGKWTGTMCLTEPQCGSDLAQVKTKATPQSDGTYKVRSLTCRRTAHAPCKRVAGETRRAPWRHMPLANCALLVSTAGNGH
jgi:alkylation response protein AidB-like acyl-CoA dehydrogenase